MTGSRGGHMVDWERVEAELATIDEDYKSRVRFDPAPHVVKILSSIDPDDELRKLQEKANRVEALVDTVVEVHHNSFNKAIQNYSQILKLFTESTSQIEKLKTDIYQAKVCAAMRNTTLQKQWNKNISLTHMLRTLDSISAATKVPTKLQNLFKEKSFESAAKLLQETMATLDRDQMDKLAALKPLRSELYEWSEKLTTSMVEEVLAQMFCQEADEEDNADAATLALSQRAAMEPLINGLHKLQGLVTLRTSLQQRLQSELRAKFARNLVEMKHESRPKHAPAPSPPGSRSGVEAAEAARYLQRVLGVCARLLGMVQWLEETVDAHLRRGGTPAHSPQPNVAKEVRHLWGILQEECQHLLREMLSTPTCHGQTRRMSLDISEPLVFSFGGVREVGDAAAALHVAAARAAPEGQGHAGAPDSCAFAGKRATSTCAHDAAGADAQGSGLGRGAALPLGGVFLTPVLYRPIVDFVDQVQLLLPNACISEGAGLRVFIEDYAAEHFLPQVCAEMRARVAHAASHPNARALPPRLRGTVYADPPHAAPSLLYVVQDAHASLLQLLDWALAIPPVAGEIFKLMEMIATRTLESCRSCLADITKDCVSAAVVQRPNVASLLAADPSFLAVADSRARSAVDPSATHTPDEALAAATTAAAHLGHLAISTNKLQEILLEVPLDQSQLLKGTSQLSHIAAIADSMDFLAAALPKLVGVQDQAANPSQTGPASTNSQWKKSAENSSNTDGGVGLVGVARRCRQLAGDCLHILRTELQFQCRVQVQNLKGALLKSSHGVMIQEVEMQGCGGMLTTLTERADRALAPFLHPSKRVYIFGGLASITAAAIRALLDGVDMIGEPGVKAMQRLSASVCRALEVVHHNHSTLDSVHWDPGTDKEFQKPFAQTDCYFQLLYLPPDVLLDFVATHKGEYTESEYKALFNVHCPIRTVPVDEIHRGLLQKILASWTSHGSRGGITPRG